jgi:hypothetical protein
LQLNPSEAIWRPSTTFSGRLYSTGTLLSHDHQRSTVLPNRLPPACTSAWWRSVVGSRAPGLIYASIFSCLIPRISFAFQLRAPNPYQNARVVVYRRGSGPKWGSPPHRAVSAWIGEKKATCNCRTSPGGPKTFVYGIRGRTGKIRGFQVLGEAHRA